jgi:hypothetical protein
MARTNEVLHRRWQKSGSSIFHGRNVLLMPKGLTGEAQTSVGHNRASEVLPVLFGLSQTRPSAALHFWILSRNA